MNMQEPYEIIKTLRVTEKGSSLTEKHNTYVMKVDRRANKVEIAKAVEKIFKVEVTGVNTLNVHGKQSRNRRTGRSERQSSWKKAFVTLKAGDKIEFGVT